MVVPVNQKYEELDMVLVDRYNDTYTLKVLDILFRFKLNVFPENRKSTSSRSEIVAAIFGFSLVLFIFCNGCAVWSLRY